MHGKSDRNDLLLRQINAEWCAVAHAVTLAHNELFDHIAETDDILSERVERMIIRLERARAVGRMAEVLCLVRRGRLKQAAHEARQSREQVVAMLAQ
jgi:hypothetical protein